MAGNTEEQNGGLKSENGKTPKKGSTRKKAVLRWVLGGIFLFLLLIALLGLLVGRHFLKQVKSPEGEIDPKIKESIMSLAQSTEAMQLARSLKADYNDLLQALKKQDLSRASEIRGRITTDIQSLEDYFNSPIWRAAGSISAVSDEIAAVREYLEIAKALNTEVIDPLLVQLEAYPLSSMKADDGVHVDVIIAYLDFAEQWIPDLEACSDRLNAADKSILKLIDSEGKLKEYTGTLTTLVGTAKPYLQYLPRIRSILGSDGDRLYVFAAQNTSEIRASGGFPGSVGAIRIQDGVLSIVDFQSVYQVFSSYPALEEKITPTESLLFNDRMSVSWDADFSPDFERVAYIWAMAYQGRCHEHVDGVISATPVIIQRLLSFLGKITLSDGTVLNGKNAMRVLQHDLYYQYLSTNSGMSYESGNRITDQLFAETARSTLDLLFSSMSLKCLRSLLPVLQQSFDDRSLLVWMADADEQDMIRRLGCSGTLNQDKSAPEIGVFFNSTSASKMGWYLDIEIRIGDPVDHEDGSQTWPVSVCYSNTLTQEERDVAGKYILGDGHGKLVGGMYLFAPAGGSISSCQASSGNMETSTYRGLDLVYQYNAIEMGSSIVIDCEVTTAAGSHSPLAVIQTPTAQLFREE